MATGSRLSVAGRKIMNQMGEVTNVTLNENLGTVDTGTDANKGAGSTRDTAKFEKERYGDKAIQNL